MSICIKSVLIDLSAYCSFQLMFNHSSSTLSSLKIKYKLFSFACKFVGIWPLASLISCHASYASHPSAMANYCRFIKVSWLWNPCLWLLFPRKKIPFLLPLLPLPFLQKAYTRTFFFLFFLLSSSLFPLSSVFSLFAPPSPLRSLSLSLPRLEASSFLSWKK